VSGQTPCRAPWIAILVRRLGAGSRSTTNLLTLSREPCFRHHRARCKFGGQRGRQTRSRVSGFPRGSMPGPTPAPPAAHRDQHERLASHAKTTVLTYCSSTRSALLWLRHRGARAALLPVVAAQEAAAAPVPGQHPLADRRPGSERLRGQWATAAIQQLIRAPSPVGSRSQSALAMRTNPPNEAPPAGRHC